MDIAGMDVLLDIIKFLKKLQSGQHDIEAGQFELYEGMENVNKALNELKTMKKDVDDMKESNAKQIEIIKDLENKLDKLNEKYKSNKGTRSRSATYYSERYGNTLPKKGYRQQVHRHIEEVVDITSDPSKDNWNSIGSEDEGNEHSTWTEKETNVCAQKRTPKSSCMNPSKRKRTHGCKNNEMLQRYLQDSAKYRDTKMSKTSVVSYGTHDRNVQTGPSDVPRTNREDANCEDPNGDKRQVNEEIRRTSKAMPAKSFCCPVCSKKFTKGIDYSMHKKNHVVIRCRICRKAFTNKERLKQHLVVHKVKPKKFEGFTCCYCHLVCTSPEKLTAHLRKCRIITKTSHKNTPL